MNQQQLRFVESFKSHIPNYEDKISSKYNLEKVIPLDDPPQLFEVDIKSLSSLFLNSNPQFQTLLSAIMSWNQMTKHYNSNPPKSLRKEHNNLWINNTIITQLVFLLNEIVITTDRKLQLKMLNCVFDWYYKEIGRKPQQTAIVSSSVVENISRPHTSATSSINRAEASFERGGLRSEHANYDFPKVRLKDFSRRLPNYNDFSMSSTTALSYQKMTAFGGDSRPQTSPFGTVFNCNENFMGRPQTTTGDIKNEQGMNGNRINISSLLSRNTMNRMNLEEQNIALKREIRSSQDKRGSSKQIMGIRSNFINCFFDDNPEERKLEEIWFKQRHKALAEKKEDEELVIIMKEWACNKGRVEEEMVRKGEGDKNGTEFNQVKYEINKKVVLNEEDAELVLQEYPEIVNPDNEYVKLENGMDINKLRVLNEPAEIKGGEEIYVDKKNEIIELNNIPLEKEMFLTPDKERANNKPEGFNAKTRVFESIQSNNTASTALSLDKQNNLSLFQSLETSNKEENFKEIDEKIRIAKEKSKKANKQRPSTEHEKKRKFIKYTLVNNDKLIGDICDSPVIKLLKPSQIIADEEKEKRNIKIVDFYGNHFENRSNKTLQNYEYQISKQKIKDLRNHFAQNIKDLPLANNQNNPNTDNINQINSLSVYSRPLSQQHVYRNFSNIFKPNLSKEVIRQQQFNEIDEIKRRMGRWGVRCSTKKLENALLMPLAIFGEKFKIAESGTNLFENPFNKVEKKKKKKNSSIK